MIFSFLLIVLLLESPSKRDLIRIYQIAGLDKKLAALETVVSKAKKPSPELLEEVKKVAQFTAAHTSGETAKSSAEDISRNIAQDVAQEELLNLKMELSEQFTDQIKSATSTAKYLGIAGMLLGFSAIILFVLKM